MVEWLNGNQPFHYSRIPERGGVDRPGDEAMTDREVLTHRFNALMASIRIARSNQTAPNLSVDAMRRLQERIDQDVDEGIRLSALIAELDMRKKSAAVDETRFIAARSRISEAPQDFPPGALLRT